MTSVAKSRLQADEQIILDAGAVAPGHFDCMLRALEFCPHLRELEDLKLKAFPDSWQVTPMLLKAVAKRRGASTAATETVVAIDFPQLCGVTAMLHPLWQRC